jgi:hypothetical protein
MLFCLSDSSIRHCCCHFELCIVLYLFSYVILALFILLLHSVCRIYSSVMTFIVDKRANGLRRIGVVLSRRGKPDRQVVSRQAGDVHSLWWSGVGRVLCSGGC